MIIIIIYVKGFIALKKNVLTLVLMVSLVVVVVACGNSNNNTAPTTSTPAATEPPASVSTSPEASENATPIAVDEAKATELLAQFGNTAPAKIVTMSVSITEILNELGIVPVGVPTSSITLPAAFDQVPRVGSSHQPDLEQIAKLEPDVILGPSSIKDSLEKSFKSANLPTAYLPVDSLEELKLSTVVLGRLFKQESKAEAFLQNFSAAENAALSSAKDKKAPSVMFLFGSAESLMFMNEDTFAGSLAKNLGASNVVSDTLKLNDTYVPLDMESLVAANPDVILMVAHGDPAAATKKFEEDTKKNGAWEKLNAFKNKTVIALDYSLFGTASIVKAPDAYKELRKILYP